MNLQAKEVMKANFKVYFCNDSILQIANELTTSEEDISFVKNLEGKLIGYLTIRDILKAILSNMNSINEIKIHNRELVQILSTAELNEEAFKKNDVVAVVNELGELIGSVSKSTFKKETMRRELKINKKYKQIFTAAHNGILAIDADGRISAINPAAANMAKTTQEQAVGQLLNDVVITKGLLKVIRTGEPHSEKYTAGKSKYLAHRTPIYDGKKLVGAVGVFQKLSEIETVSEELYAVQHLEKEMHAIIDTIPEGICLIDRQGNIVKKNKTFAENYISLFENIEQSTRFREAIDKVITKKANDCVKIASMKLSFTILENDNGTLEKIICVVASDGASEELKHVLLKKKRLLKWTLNPRIFPRTAEKSKIAKIIIRKIKQVGPLDIPICIIGEKGTDFKNLCFEVVNKSSRRDMPTVEFNCENYTASQQVEILFGSSTIESEELGLLDCLDGGTLIIHHLEKMDANCQKVFLQFLRKQESDVRIIATIEGNPEIAIAKNEINEELYYLLNVSSIYLPNLSERKEDIEFLIDDYLLQLNHTYKREIEITREAKDLLGKKSWPGNEQELFELLHLVYLLSKNVIDEELIHSIHSQINVSSLAPIVVRKVLPLKEAVDELEKQLILKVKETEKSYRKIAKILDVDASTIARKIKKLEIANIEVS